VTWDKKRKKGKDIEVDTRRQGDGHQSPGRFVGDYEEWTD